MRKSVNRVEVGRRSLEIVKGSVRIVANGREVEVEDISQDQEVQVTDLIGKRSQGDMKTVIKLSN